MKKFMFCLAVAVGMSSCAAEVCYECTTTISTCKVTACGGRASGNGGACDAAASASNILYTTNDAHRNYLQQVGYTCVQK